MSFDHFSSMKNFMYVQVRFFRNLKVLKAREIIYSQMQDKANTITLNKMKHPYINIAKKICQQPVNYFSIFQYILTLPKQFLFVPS